MHKIRFGRRVQAAIIAASLAVGASGAATAQNQSTTPAEALKSSLQTLSSSPNDVDALVRAGYASVALGDLPAAGGFFGRAADLSPNDPRPQAGMGAAMAQAGDAERALLYFTAAEARGAGAAEFGVDRGLAHDLMGNLKAAEADYRAGLGRYRDADARRRLALNLAMQGERTAAIAFLQPLLNQGDPAAQRARAFVLALTGDFDGARRAIDYAMPGSADRIDPFFRRLPLIDNAQKAAAVHLGRFPSDSDVRMSRASEGQSEPRLAEVERTIAPQPRPRREQRRSRGEASRATRSSRNSAFDLASRPPSEPSRRPETDASGDGARLAATEPVATSQPGPAANDRAVETFELPSAQPPAAQPAGDRLASIDDLLGNGGASTGSEAIVRRVVANPPPAPRPKVEVPPPPQPKVETAAPQRAPDIGVAGTHWVQIAGGRKDAMNYEWRRLKRQAGSVLDGKSGHVTQGVDFFRLLVGPFDNAREAQLLVNELKAEGVDSFAWRRNPARLRIEKL